jgi:hypothetical protein
MATLTLCLASLGCCIFCTQILLQPNETAVYSVNGGVAVDLMALYLSQE